MTPSPMPSATPHRRPSMLPSRTARHPAPHGAAPRGAALLVAALTVAGLPPRVVGAQAASPTPPRTYAACYVPSTGTVYRIDKPQGSTPGAPAACGTNRKGVADVEFSWTDGDGALRVSDAAGGDVAGTFGSLTVARLLGRALATTPPADGQVLVWDAGSSSWAARTPAAGGVSVHGQLQGLGNDDHPQYLLGNGTRNSPNGFAVTGSGGAPLRWTAPASSCRCSRAHTTGVSDRCTITSSEPGGTPPSTSTGARAPRDSSQRTAAAIRTAASSKVGRYASPSTTQAPAMRASSTSSSCVPTSSSWTAASCAASPSMAFCKA